MVSSLFRYLVDINKFQPDVVVLQIGSNDVRNIQNSVENVGSAMKYFIDMLYDMNVQHVIVGLPSCPVHNSDHKLFRCIDKPLILVLVKPSYD
jgi:lysophospholipase L1-like esterase